MNEFLKKTEYSSLMEKDILHCIHGHQGKKRVRHLVWLGINKDIDPVSYQTMKKNLGHITHVEKSHISLGH